MLKTYKSQNGVLEGGVLAAGSEIDPHACWLDLFEPTEEERDAVGRVLGTALPTRADMEEIEISSRLHQDAGFTFMTALVLANSESDHPSANVVSFVLSAAHLVTIRYVDLQPFRTFAARCERGAIKTGSPRSLLLALLDVLVDRMADILERIGADIESVSREIFEPGTTGRLNTKAIQTVLRTLGRKNDLTGKMRESLLTISRMLSFLTQQSDDQNSRRHLDTLARDIQSLQDHSSYLASKLSYLLDATLGLINIDQNDIIKIMSVAAMVFLPPTLIASIEGMNFRNMPELAWPFGYPLSIALMVISAIVPYLWFKRRGWL